MTDDELDALDKEVSRDGEIFLGRPVGVVLARALVALRELREDRERLKHQIHYWQDNSEHKRKDNLRLLNNRRALAERAWRKGCHTGSINPDRCSPTDGELDALLEDGDDRTM
jgi:hypothetical protein